MSVNPAKQHDLMAAAATSQDSSASMPLPTAASTGDNGQHVDGARVASAAAPHTPVYRNIQPASTTTTSALREDRLTDEPDIFTDASGRPRNLRGVAVYSGATRLAEMAARIGFETVWIEMEHGPADFGHVESLCMAIESGGGIPTVRIPDGQRHHVLRAVEVGAQIVVVPMINTAEQARQVVQYGKFPPLGARGYNVRSRGVQYGLFGPGASFARANDRTYLFAQIETTQAVDNLDEICDVKGLSGIFIGPGDLSVSYGCTGQLGGQRLIDTVCHCIRRARGCGLHAGILVPPGAMLNAAIEAGCDLMFYGGDVAELGNAWPKLLASVPASAAAAVSAPVESKVARR
jgi:2-keto-3-deoxy-L-rhamnonate aldolase RhmA